MTRRHWRCWMCWRCWCFLASALVSLWSEDNEHLVPFHPRSCFDLADVRQVLFEFFQDARAQFTVRHLAAAKPDCSFHFVAVLQPLARVFHAVVVVVIVRSRSKLHFLDSDRDLLLLRLVCLLLGFVLVLSKIDDPANRRIGVRSNFDQIQTFVTGSTNGIAHIHDAQLFSFLANHAYLRYANSLVDSNRRRTPVIRTLTATAKACSYCCTSWVCKLLVKARVSTNVRAISLNSSSDIEPMSPRARSRTASARCSISRSPSTSMNGTFCNCALRIFAPILSPRKFVSTLKPPSRSSGATSSA